MSPFQASFQLLGQQVTLSGSCLVDASLQSLLLSSPRLFLVCALCLYVQSFLLSCKDWSLVLGPLLSDSGLPS